MTGLRAWYRFSTFDDPERLPPGSNSSPSDLSPQPDLPYRVELWDSTKSVVELVLATTVSSSIGFAAYHAATLEYPESYIVLRHQDAVLSRWNAPGH
ncbi:hypothetical protein [Hyphomicrobium sp.]|uniref:hypothetical protein n=1 Tax=Hyphomicrobium sp. TaxID=82 RepID=UPI002D773BED|nr:hypothetical protein [Hyphomicrobium sp.]HET6390405.1 hypothetical protein [Hyphomicrobium sp.]